MSTVIRFLGRLLGALLALAALGILLVGVPWGLWTYIGWPLPEHLPTRNELAAVLLNPLSVSLFLDILACIAWVAWLVFTVDVARCVPDVLRGIQPPQAGPLQAVAGFLLAATLLGALGSRGMVPTASALADSPALTQVTRHVPVVSAEEPFAPTISDYSASGTVTVRSPHNGVHDSLWRIARRELGDGTRWHELFELNRGRTQVDGSALTDPDFLRPGWVLTMPGSESVSVPPAPSKRPVPPVPETDSPAVPEPTPALVSQRTHSSPSQVGGIALVTGGFLAVGLASAVAAVLARRLRRRLRGSGGEPEQPLAPVVRALRIADDQHRLDLDEGDLTFSSSPPASFPPETGADLTTSVNIGVRDGHAYAVDVAALHGLGITGAGAEATARALLVHLLGTTAATVVVPEADAVALLGAELPDSSRLWIAPDLDAAITELNTRLQHTDTDEPLHTVLLARGDAAESRLQALLERGSGSGIAGIVLGHWPAGSTVRVRADGTVTAASPEIDTALGAARLFHVGATDTRDLIELFSDTQVTSQPSRNPTGDTLEGTSADADSIEHDQLSEVTDEDSSYWPPDVKASPSPEEPQPERPTSSHPADDEPQEDHPQRPLVLSLCGRVTVHWNTAAGQQDLTPLFAPKHKALLIMLALYRDGTTREVVREALWPEARGNRPFNAFYSTLSQIRKILTRVTGEHAVDLIDQHGEHVGLNADLVEVDYWQLHDAEHDRHIATTEEQRLTACSRIVAVYEGELAEGMSALWLDGPREAAHRAVVDALASMAAHYRGVDPQRQLQLLEHARLLNPENEDIYRDIMRVQAELGLTDAISRTLQLLTTALAELGTRPDPNTVTLARALQNREHQRTAAG